MENNNQEYNTVTLMLDDNTECECANNDRIEEYFEDTPHTLFNRVCLGGLGVCDRGLSVTGVRRVNTTCTAVADRCGDRCACEAADCCSTCEGSLKDAYDCRNEVTDI